jgi:hypothetical protein
VSIEGISGKLAQIADGLSSAALRQAAESLAEAAETLGQCAAGTDNPELLEAVQQLVTARHQVLETWQLVRAAKQAILRYREQITGGDPVAAPATKSTAVAQPPLSATNRDARAAAIMAGLPERTPTNPKTSGYWIDDDGREHGPMTSGRDDGYRAAVDELRMLRLSPGRGTLFATEHVEVKFAVCMRRSTARHATLIINNTPCAPGRYSCDKLIPQILRSDQTVTAYWPGGKKTYTGRRP